MNGNYQGHILRIVIAAPVMNANWFTSIGRAGNNA